MGDWIIEAVREQVEAAPPVAEHQAGLARPSLGSLTPGGLAALQRGLGNRATAALIQRLVPATGPPAQLAPEQEPGGNTATTAEEEAAIAATAHRRAEARRLLAAEVEEVGTLAAIGSPVGPGIVAGNGTRKLLEAVGRLGSRAAGPAAGYQRDPATLEGLPSFVAGKLDDPEGRITVRADGLLEVTRFHHIPQKARKGQPQPDKIVPETAIVDLQGTRIKEPPKPEEIAAAFDAQALKVAENEKAAEVLGELRASNTAFKTGDPDQDPMTLGALVSEATSGTYWQFSYFDKAKTKPTELLKKVTAAFDQLRAEFGEWKWNGPLGLMFDQPTLARLFAAKLQPALFAAASTAQSQLDQAATEQSAAQTEVDAAKAALAALPPKKTVPKAERAAYDESAKKAQARSTNAGKRLTAATWDVKNKTARRDGFVAERDKFVTTITWILDPAATTEQRAASSVGALCNVLSYFLYGKSIGLIPADTDFKDYYLAEVKQGNIRFYVGDHGPGVYYGEGSWKWEDQRNLTRLDDPHPIPRTATTPEILHPIGDPSRKDQLRAFFASGASVALSWQDFTNTPPTTPHHFIPIVKDDHGVWRNMDQTSNEFRRRGGITDWSRVFRVAVDATLYAQGQAGSSAAAAPAAH